jgi:phage terminase large subunit-like protein
MILRLSHKLNAKIKAGALPALPLHENPLADWSAQLFLAGRRQYILLSNTQSLYSTVISSKGITDDSGFIEEALRSVRECMVEGATGPPMSASSHRPAPRCGLSGH